MAISNAGFGKSVRTETLSFVLVVLIQAKPYVVAMAALAMVQAEALAVA